MRFSCTVLFSSLIFQNIENFVKVKCRFHVSMRCMTRLTAPACFGPITSLMKTRKQETWLLES